jgi:hypothetical protein
VYVVGFPDTTTGRWPVSLAGGTEVRWSHGGNELFFRAPGDEMMVVPVETSPTFRPGVPRVLFTGRFSRSPLHRNYDVSPDDQRFLMVRQLPAPPDAGARLIYVQNFAEELRQRVKR